MVKRKKSALGLDKLDAQAPEKQDTIKTPHPESTEPKQQDSTTLQQHGNVDPQFAALLPVREPSPTTRTAGGLLRKPIYFDSELWEAVDELARQRGISASEVVRFGLRHFLGMDLSKARQAPGPK